MKIDAIDERLELPLYGFAEAAKYLRLPKTTLEYWVHGTKRIPAIIRAAGEHPRSLSFMNLLECHMLSALKNDYNLRMPKIRKALVQLQERSLYRHPLVEEPLYTNRVDIIHREIDKFINLNKPGQYVNPDLLLHFERIEKDSKGLLKFFPFVMGRTKDEPRFIVINPAVGFGKPVISGTGISTAVIASRFNARDSIGDLAAEYGLQERQIEEAIRWESRTSITA